MPRDNLGEVTCSECRQRRPRYLKRVPLCRKCYDRRRKQGRVGHCHTCGLTRVLQSRGLCRACYMRPRRVNPQKAVAKRERDSLGASVRAPLVELYAERAARGEDLFQEGRR